MSAIWKAIVHIFRVLFTPSPHAPAPTPAGPPPWYEIGREYLGLKEVPGSGDNPTIVKWMQISGLAKSLWRDATAWCGVAVGNWFFKAGFKREDLPPALAWARNFANFGIAIENFLPGCLVGLERNGPGGDSHVGLYAGPASAKTFYLLGGNQSNAVTIAEYAYADVIYKRWPSDAALERAGLGEWKLSKVLEREKGGPAPKPPTGGEYAQKYASMVIRPEWREPAREDAEKVLRGRKRYLDMEQRTGVPWELVGIFHCMESGCDFSTHLHNGDPLSARTVRVPAGRPRTGTPPFSWEESAVDALAYDGIKAPLETIDQKFRALEAFNGFGYRKRGINSPYLWSGSTYYLKGKYVKDGPDGWDPDAVSKQVGAAVIHKMLEEMGQI